MALKIQHALFTPHRLFGEKQFLSNRCFLLSIARPHTTFCYIFSDKVHEFRTFIFAKSISSDADFWHRCREFFLQITLIYSIAVHEYFQIMRTDMVNILSRFFSAYTVHSSVCILKSAARKGVSSKHMYEKSIDTISRFIVLNDKRFILFLFWRRQDL